MRCVLVLALVPAAAFAAAVKIDHVTVAGADIKKLQANLEAAGVRSVYGGAHSNHTTEMALVSFPDGSYLELMGLQRDASSQRVEGHEWAKYLKGNAGPSAWAVRLEDIAAEVKRLAAAGISVSPPQRSGRDRPDGVRLEWETSTVGTEPRGTFFPFLIHDFTPREQRAFPRGEPVTRDFQGIARVVIAVRSLDDAVKRYRRAYQLPEPVRQVDKSFEASLAWMDSVPVVLAQPLAAGSWLAGRIDRFGEGPCAFVLTVAQPGRHRAVSKSRWFGTDISWFDPKTVGWRLGFEPSR